ncbi:MAG: hydantoinase/oxoprolinase family protein, partial [Gammaproteobacteria bacterium]|nr:hydantoinase/oxoprolinase family protein [Gammaproteobacteria bacterium]
PSVKAQQLARGVDPESAVYERQAVFVGGEWLDAKIYDRARIGSGAKVPGPAIVTEMDATTLILPGHLGTVDDFGNILITPESKGSSE